VTERTRVVFIVNSLNVGGVEKATIALFNGMDAARFEPALVYLKGGDALLSQVQTEAGPCWTPNLGRGLDLFGLLRLAHWLKRFSPDVLLVANTYPLLYGWLARWLLGSGLKLICSFHSTLLKPAEHKRVVRYFRHLFHRCDAVIYVCKAQQQYWLEHGIQPTKSFVVYNGVDTTHYVNNYSAPELASVRAGFGFEREDFVVGICAALRPEKMHTDLLRVVASLGSEGQSIKCLLIGDGPCRSTIEALIAELGLAGRVHITGFVQDVRPLIAACNCTAIVSHEETFSIAALESMALSRPVIISRIGGAAEMVRDGENGYLYPAGDLSALARALKNMLEPGRCEALGRKAREVVEQEFSQAQMIAGYGAVVDRCLS
jgi:glycosyltransferase involved in cell wall biosynthesis